MDWTGRDAVPPEDLSTSNMTTASGPPPDPDVSWTPSL
jgi:hypothetical protein